MTRPLIIFLLSFHFSYGQKIEQIALNYLLENISTLSIKDADGQFKFTNDSNEIWYSSRIHADNNKTIKLKIKNGLNSNLDQFHKTYHSGHDIFIRTYPSQKSSDRFYVWFDIITKYNNLTKCIVYLDNTFKPYSIQQTVK